MLRILLIGFLIAHGLVHVAIWAPRYDPEKASFDASLSWLMGDQRALARALAFAAAALLVLAGIALWSHGGRWRPTAVVGLGASTVLLLLYFTLWYLFILPVNLAVIVGIAFMEWPAKTTVGAWAAAGDLRSARGRTHRSRPGPPRRGQGTSGHRFRC